MNFSHQFISVAGNQTKRPSFEHFTGFKIWQVGTRTAWTPVQNLTFSGEVMYTFLDQSFTGSQTLAAFGFKPAGVYDFKDSGIVTGNVRVRRTW